MSFYHHKSDPRYTVCPINERYGFEIVLCGNDEHMNSFTEHALDAADEKLGDLFAKSIVISTDFKDWNGGCYYQTNYVFNQYNAGCFVIYYEREPNGENPEEADDWYAICQKEVDISLDEEILLEKNLQEIYNAYYEKIEKYEEEYENSY